MAEQSHREEMNAAIRAQRARHAVPRTITPEPPPERPEPPAAAASGGAERPRRRLGRLLGR